MQNKQDTPSKFQILQIPRSPVTASPNKNLTGTPRVARDIVADLFNTIQTWNASHIKGSLVVKQIALLKADTVDAYSAELEECTNSLFLIVQNLKIYVNQFNKLIDQISALDKMDKQQEPLFISLSLGEIVDLVECVVNGYLKEFEVKELVLENIAHCKNKDEVMFYAACWTHQPNINSFVNLKLETLLVETGHRKVTY